MEFRMLGPFDVIVGGESISLGGAKQRALLAILAIHANEIVSVDRLIDELWGARPPATAPNTLQTYVSRLRKILHGDPGVAIVSRSPGYVLRTELEQIDAHRFVQRIAEAQAHDTADERSTLLSEALDLWRGTALVDFRFEPFAQNEIGRLEELRLGALESRIEADLACSRHAALVPELETLVADNPLRERLREYLMLALYRSGRQVEALEVYRSGRRRLVDELGIEPGPRLQELERAILAHDRAIDAPPTIGGRRFPRRAWLVAAAVALTLASAAAAVAVLRDAESAAQATVRVKPHAVAIVDPASNSVVATRRIGGWPMPIVQGGGYVWAANVGDDTVSRIDPIRRLVLDNFYATTPLELAWRRGVIWIANGNSYDGPDPPGGGTIERYDVETRDLVQTRVSPPADNLLIFIAAGPEGVWAGSPSESRVVKLDARTGRIVSAVPTTIQVSGMALGAGSLWVSDAINDSVYRIDPATNMVVERIHVADGPRRLAVGEDAVWVVGEFPRSRVWRIDLRVNRAVAHVAVPARANWVAVGARDIWVTSRTPGHAGPGSLTRIDPKTNKVVATIDLGFSPQGVVVANGLVWVVIGPM
jgi:YVTN family beta-propeller protein